MLIISHMKLKMDWNKNPKMDDLFESGGIFVQRQAEPSNSESVLYDSLNVNTLFRYFSILR